MTLFKLTEPLPDEVRARIAQEWLTAGQMEHASVASFARFSLQLMALAAPPDLLELSHQAGLDEIKHARMCFRVASAFLEQPVGPGPLAIDDELLGTGELVEVAVATVHEGCIGETIGTLEAAEAQSQTYDPHLRAILETIQEDEGRHGELAWAFVGWALNRARPQQREVILGAFDTIQIIPPEMPPIDPHQALLRRYGCLTERCRYQVREAMLRDVLQPAVEALRERYVAEER